MYTENKEDKKDEEDEEGEKTGWASAEENRMRAARRGEACSPFACSERGEPRPNGQETIIFKCDFK